MPRLVDHQQRRQRIADGVCRLAADRGLDEVSLRHVAAEAGVSMGQVQHYFSTKDEMLLFAFRALGERVEARINAAGAIPGRPPTDRAALRALLRELLPVSKQARAEAPVWIAFLARAIVEPQLRAAVQGKGGQQLREFLRDRIRAAQEAGAPAGLDPGREATTLLALVDGMMIAILMGQLDAAEALATLDYHLDRLFGTVGRNA